MINNTNSTKNIDNIKSINKIDNISNINIINQKDEKRLRNKRKNFYHLRQRYCQSNKQKMRTASDESFQLY